MTLRLFVPAALVVVAGCAGTGQALPKPLVSTPSSHGTITAVFRIVVPRKTSSASDVRHTSYISPNTAAVEVVDQPASGPLTRTFAYCSSVCEVDVAAPLGSNTFVVGLFDASGQLLSAGQTTVTILAGVVNNVSLTFDPVVASVALPYLTAPSGKPAHIVAKPILSDPSGAFIAGPGVLINNEGRGVTILVQVNDPSGHTTISGGTITAPSQSFTLNYDGTPNTLRILTATVSGLSTPATSGSFASATMTPFAVADGASIYPLATGPKAAIWAGGSFAVNSYGIAAIQSNGHQHWYKLSGDVYGPNSLTFGPDGNFWFTIDFPGFVVRVTPDGQNQTTFSLPVGSAPADIASGSDGNLWVAESRTSAIARITPSGSISQFGLSHNAHPTQIVASSDGYLYYNKGDATAIDKLSTDGSHRPIKLPGFANALTAGNDGNVWFVGTESPGMTDFVGWVTPSGVVKTFAMKGVQSTMNTISPGPGGVVWFNDESLGLRWVTPSGQIGVIPIPDIERNPQIAGTGPMREGSDGALWFTQHLLQTQHLVRLTL